MRRQSTEQKYGPRITPSGLRNQDHAEDGWNAIKKWLDGDVELTSSNHLTTSNSGWNNCQSILCNYAPPAFHGASIAAKTRDMGRMPHPDARF
jgi:hypothetical protein